MSVSRSAFDVDSDGEVRFTLCRVVVEEGIARTCSICSIQVDSVTLSGLLVLFQKCSFRPGIFFIEEDYGLRSCESLKHV